MQRLLLAALPVCVLWISADAIQADEQAKAIIDKAVKAAGGAENLAKVKGHVIKGKGKLHGVGGAEFTGEWVIADKGRFRMALDLDLGGQKIEQRLIANGKEGWIKVAGMLMDMNEEMVNEFREQSYGNEVESLIVFARKDPGIEISIVGESKIGNRDAVGIRVTKKDRRDITVHFDKEKHVVLKSETRGKDIQNAQKEVLLESFYSDYKADKNGILVPGRIEIKQDGDLFMEAEISETEALDKVDDSLFEKP